MDRVRQCFHTDAFRRNYSPFFFPRLASWKPAKILFASYLYSYSTALSCGSRTVDDLTRQLSASGKLSAGEIALFGVKLRLRSELLEFRERQLRRRSKIAPIRRATLRRRPRL